MSRRLPRATLFAAAALLMCACASPKPAVKWERIDGDGFTSEMPGVPKMQTQSVEMEFGNVAFNAYTVETGGEAFIIGHNDFPEMFNDADAGELLENAKAGAVGNVNGKIIEEKDITMAGHPGKEFVGEGVSPEGEGAAAKPSPGAAAREHEATFTARIYWVSPRLYQVLYVRPKGSAISENGRKFLDSFQLKAK